MGRTPGAKNKKTIERENQEAQAGTSQGSQTDEVTEGFLVGDAPDDTWTEPAGKGFSPKEALHGVLSRLGLASEDDPDSKVSSQEKKAPRRAGLRKAQQEFCDTVTPLAVLAFVGIMAWFWGRLGEPYRALAPTDDIATKMIAPLIRVWARTTKISAQIDPNMTDILASIAATVSYAFSCIETYSLIKKDIEARDGQQHTRQTGDLSGYVGQFDLQASNGGYAQESHAQNVDDGHFTEGERYQLNALAALRARDIEFRARRDGYALNVQ